MNDDYSEFQAAAERMAAEAGGVLREAYGRVSAREKGPADLVTEADFASQRLIDQRIREAFPDHALLAEEEWEGFETDYSRPFRWIVDPLDGTMNFAHGFPFWCVSIALEHAGELVVGVIYNPLSGETYSASLGRGTTLNGKPVRVSAVDRIENSLVTCGFPTDFGADADRQAAYFRWFSSYTHSLRRTGSSALNLAILAAGGCEVCYATSVKPWDAAAGVVLVREAGGAVSSVSGAPYDLYKPDILATNNRVHSASVGAFAEAWSAGH